jgi:hypothetical protein
VRTNGTGSFTSLTPLQQVTPTPYAIYAENAATLGGQSGTAYVAKAGDTMTGTLNLPANGLTVGGGQLVASGGNVGIGTSSPAGKLHVYGNSAAGSHIPSNTAALASGDGFNNRFMSVDGDEAVYLSMFTAGYGEVSTFNYATGTPLPLIFNSNGGNVGIGTKSPQNQLEVQLSISSTNLSVPTSAVKGIYSPSGAYGALAYTYYQPPNVINIRKQNQIQPKDYNNSSVTYGIYGIGSNGDYAGWFDGTVEVNGNLSAKNASFGSSIGNSVVNTTILNVEGYNYGSYSGALALFQNNDGNPINGSPVGNTTPALRVVGWGNTANGALSVSANGTGLIAQFGNNQFFVADIQTNGTIDAVKFNTTSDRNVKEDFTAVDPSVILAKVVAMPVQSWSYKMLPGEKHIGPMAQDFHGAFGLNGADDKHIATVDEEGIALAAIQGLNQRVDEKDAQIQKLKQQNDSLAGRLQNLEQMMQTLTEKK